MEGCLEVRRCAKFLADSLTKCSPRPGMPPCRSFFFIRFRVECISKGPASPMDALVDLWISVLKSALPFLPEFSALVLQDALRDALEIHEMLIPALIVMTDNWQHM